MFSRRLAVALTVVALGSTLAACDENFNGNNVIDYATGQSQGTTQEYKEKYSERGVCPSGYVQKVYGKQTSLDWKKDCVRQKVKVCPTLPYEVWDSAKGAYVKGGCFEAEDL